MTFLGFMISLALFAECETVIRTIFAHEGLAPETGILIFGLFAAATILSAGALGYRSSWQGTRPLRRSWKKGVGKLLLSLDEKN